MGTTFFQTTKQAKLAFVGFHPEGFIILDETVNSAISGGFRFGFGYKLVINIAWFFQG